MEGFGGDDGFGGAGTGGQGNVDQDMFGVDNFQQDADHSESHGSLFHDEDGQDPSNSQADPFQDDPNQAFGNPEDDADLNASRDGIGMGWNDEAAGDLPDAEDHRAATGASRDRSGRSRKMLFLIACLFCIGVGAGLAVVFIVQGGDDDSPAPRTTVAPTSAPSQTKPDEVETQPPTIAPSTLLPTAVPTPQPTTFEESNQTFAPTVANSTVDVTFIPTVAPNENTTALPTQAPSNATDAPTLNATEALPTLLPSLAPSSNISLAPSSSNSSAPSPEPEGFIRNLVKTQGSWPAVAPVAVGNVQMPTRSADQKRRKQQREEKA